MPSQIDLYQEMGTLSTQMVEAAHNQDWEKLIALEHSLGGLRDTLIAANNIRPLNQDELDPAAGLIRRILEDTEEVRRHVDPWKDELRQVLGDLSSQLKIARAYDIEDT